METQTEQEIKVICCNCCYGDKEDWIIKTNIKKFNCPNCNDSFIINEEGNIQEE